MCKDNVHVHNEGDVHVQEGKAGYTTSSGDFGHLSKESNRSALQEVGSYDGVPEAYAKGCFNPRGR